MKEPMLFAHSADHAMGYCVDQERYKKTVKDFRKTYDFLDIELSHPCLLRQGWDNYFFCITFLSI